MARRKNIQWSVSEGQIQCWEEAIVSVLMDLRDELQDIGLKLQTITNVLCCPDTTAIPLILRSILRNTEKPPKKTSRRSLR